MHWLAAEEQVGEEAFDCFKSIVLNKLVYYIFFVAPDKHSPEPGDIFVKIIFAHGEDFFPGKGLIKRAPLSTFLPSLQIHSCVCMEFAQEILCGRLEFFVMHSGASCFLFSIK